MFFFFQFTHNPSWKKKNQKIKIQNKITKFFNKIIRNLYIYKWRDETYFTRERMAAYTKRYSITVPTAENHQDMFAGMPWHGQSWLAWFQLFLVLDWYLTWYITNDGDDERGNYGCLRCAPPTSSDILGPNKLFCVTPNPVGYHYVGSIRDVNLDSDVRAPVRCFRL